MAQCVKQYPHHDYHPVHVIIITSIQDDSENGQRESYSGAQYRAFTADLINKDANLESFWPVLWSYWGTYREANK